MRYGKLLICGDFNLTPDPKMDSTSSKPSGTASFRKLLHTEDLFDAWRCIQANERDYTCFSHRHYSYSRIDMYFTDKWLLQQISDAKIYDITWSDHVVIALSINEQGVSPSSPIWRCNVRLLQEHQTQKMISQHI